jgi:4-amino-4-deoxy-L-arabinose transferase-like glycosyltransferase
VLGSALCVSIGGKAALLAANAVPFNADEAVVALMARHILAGERPLFFYGQAYMGSLDAALAAAGFSLFGPHVWVVRAVQMLLFAGTMILWHRFCATAFDSAAVANIAVWLLAIPPVFLTLYTTSTLGGYGEALFFGSLCMVLAMQIIRQNSTIGRWLALGIAAGIGFWSFPLSLLLTGPACLAAVAFGPAPRHRTGMRIGMLALGAAVGAFPWIIGWIRMGASALEELGGSAIAGTLSGGPGEVLSIRLLNLFLFGTAALFGLRPSWEWRWLVPAAVPVVLTIHLATAACAAVSLRRRDPARPARWMLAGSAAALAGLYIFTPFGNDPSGRYFLPLCLPLAAFAADFTVRTAARIGRASLLLPAVLLAYQAAGTLDCAARIPPGITTQFDPVAQLDQGRMMEVIDFLRSNGETIGYTNYWVSFPLAFLSGEDLVFTARLPYHEDLRYTPRDDRYPPYDRIVESADHTAYITTKNPALDSLLESAFEELGVTYRVKQIGDFRVYYRLSRPVRPEEILPG